ncbi:hypothetical protein TNCV_2219141 [Trichonephila clavipes]|nr:hypothetical protein TNCV_2219141 [Trichonephila clavipes]
MNEDTRHRIVVASEVQGTCRRATKSVCVVPKSRYTNFLRWPNWEKMQQCGIGGFWHPNNWTHMSDSMARICHIQSVWNRSTGMRRSRIMNSRHYFPYF